MYYTPIDYEYNITTGFPLRTSHTPAAAHSRVSRGLPQVIRDPVEVSSSRIIYVNPKTAVSVRRYNNNNNIIYTSSNTQYNNNNIVYGTGEGGGDGLA